MILYSLEASFRIRWILMLNELPIFKRIAWKSLSVWNATFFAPRVKIIQETFWWLIIRILSTCLCELTVAIKIFRADFVPFFFFSTRQNLFRPINEEMRQASFHFTQKGKYRVLHEAVVSCSWLLLKSITLPWKPDVFVCRALFHPTTSRGGSQKINECRPRQRRWRNGSNLSTLH